MLFILKALCNLIRKLTGPSVSISYFIPYFDIILLKPCIQQLLLTVIVFHCSLVTVIFIRKRTHPFSEYDLN